MIQTQTRKNALTRHQKVKHIFLFCHNCKTYVQKWVSITFNTSMYNKPRANYKRRKVLHTPSIIYSRGFFILCKKNIFGWAGVKGLLLRAEGGQLKDVAHSNICVTCWVGRSKAVTPVGGWWAILVRHQHQPCLTYFHFGKSYGRLRYKTYDENLRHQHHGGRNSTT